MAVRGMELDSSVYDFARRWMLASEGSAVDEGGKGLFMAWFEAANESWGEDAAIIMAERVCCRVGSGEQEMMGRG